MKVKGILEAGGLSIRRERKKKKKKKCISWDGPFPKWKKRV